MEITNIVSGDYELFRQLLIAYYREGEDADTDEAVIVGFVDDLFSMVMDGRISGNLIQLNDEVIGFALWMIDKVDGVFSEIPGYGTFLEIGLRPNYRGNGYGLQAVQAVENQMKQLGAEYFYVSVYGPADGFWRACGYQKTEKLASNGLSIYLK